MCGDKEETISHVLGQCPAIVKLRGQYFQDYYLSVNDIFDNQHISTIIKVVLEANRGNIWYQKISSELSYVISKQPRFVNAQIAPANEEV